MATFGDLVVRLGIDKSDFDRGIGGMRGRLSSLRSVALPAAAAITAVGGAATAAAAAFVAWLKPSFEALDMLGDLSKRLGVATETLGGLQHAAKLAGVDQGALTQSITKFLDTLSNATMGTKTAVAAFAALGLKAEALKNLSLEKQFAAVADALQNIKNPADRVRIAIDLFGKSGAQMLQLFDEGGKSLIATLEEARLLGIAPSTEDVAKIQAANDAIDRMNAAWKGVANTLAIEVAPAMERLANEIRTMLPLYRMLFAVAQGGVKGFAAPGVPAVGGVGGVGGGPAQRIGHIGGIGIGGGLGGVTGGKLFKPGGFIGGAGGGLGGARGSIAPGRPIGQGIGAGAWGLNKGPGLIGSGALGITGSGGGVGGLAGAFGRGRGGGGGIAPGGIKGSAETLGRILRAGKTKDPNTPAIKSIDKNTAKTVKAIEKLVNVGGGLIIGASGAGT